MGVPRPEGRELDATLVTELLAFDESNPSSIVVSLSAARSNARGVSEVISSEMWEALNTTYNALPGQVGLGRAVGPYGFFRFVRERTAIVAGLAESTMSQDDACRGSWCSAGSLERVDMLTRLLSTAIPADGAPVDWAVLLRSYSAHEAFLRTYSREPEPSLAAEFLLLDRLFPRSVYGALTAAESCLGALEPRAGRAGITEEAQRILGRVRTGLEFRRIDELLVDLPGCSRRSSRAARRPAPLACAAISARPFRSRGAWREPDSATAARRRRDVADPGRAAASCRRAPVAIRTGWRRRTCTHTASKIFCSNGSRNAFDRSQLDVGELRGDCPRVVGENDSAPVIAGRLLDQIGVTPGAAPTRTEHPDRRDRHWQIRRRTVRRVSRDGGSQLPQRRIEQRRMDAVFGMVSSVVGQLDVAARFGVALPGRRILVGHVDVGYCISGPLPSAELA